MALQITIINTPEHCFYFFLSMHHLLQSQEIQMRQGRRVQTQDKVHIQAEGRIPNLHTGCDNLASSSPRSMYI
jgi:hypothetical protein